MKEPFRGIGKMGKRVTSIKENKKKKTFEVSFGLEKLTLSEDTFTDYLLYVGKEISSSLFLRMKKESELEGIYEYALSLLSKGSYSSYEIEEKIKKKLPEGETPYPILKRLRMNQLLNDEEYAKEYKEEKEEQGYGSIRIRDDLLKKKRISLDIVDSLSFQNEEEKAKAIALSMEKRLETYPLKQKREKAISSLLRRGFPMEICLEAVSSFRENKEESRKRLERDYSLLRKRYEKKYSGYAYRQHLFEGLLRRGYNKEDIQGIMEENIYDD